MTRAVVNPSVLVSAFIGRPDAGPGRLVAAWRDGHFEMIVSPLLLAELGDVLARPKFARWAGDGRAVAYAAAFAARSERRSDPVRSGRSVRDPRDEYLVALARETNAEVLVSLDRDLLDAVVEGVLTLEPAQFLERFSIG